MTSEKGPGVKRWQLFVAALLMVSSGWLASSMGAADRARPWRIGALAASWGPTPMIVGMRDGLLALDYRENQDFVLGVRFTQGDVTALPAAARELVQLGADLIFTVAANATKAAQMATHQISIVFSGAVDPLGAGLIQSFARPGGNITGVTNLSLELGPKRLQVFQELMPSLKRVLFPYNANDARSVALATAYRDAAHHLGVALVEQPVRTEAEAQTTLAQVRQGEVDGILAPEGASLNLPGFVLEAATQRAIPTMFEAAFWVEQGALASYGPDYYDTGRQAARLVDKIFKGANPAEIPVEVNSKIEFVINLKTAQILGLTIAPEILYQANRLIR